MRAATALVAALLLAGVVGGAARALSAAESVTIVDSPAALTSSTTATFAFTGSSGVTVFRCGLDGAVPTVCTSPKTYTGLQDGKHKFVVRGYRGNVDLGVSDSREWTIDATPPETTITSPVPAETKAASLAIAFTASEPATFECKLDAQAFQPCTSPTTVSVGFGAHTFAVRARDAAGNADPTPATAIWTRKQNLSPVARVGFLARPGKPNATSKALIGSYALPKALLGAENVVLPVGQALKLSAGKLVLPAGATTPAVIEGKEYTFTGAASSDADGKIVHYEWSVFTGGKYVKKQEGAVAVFTTSFKEVGGWSAVRLVVADDEGAADTTEFIVKVDAECTYAIVVGRFHAQADCFRRQTITKKVAPPAKGGNQDAAPTKQQTTLWTTYPSGQPALVNGIKVDPEGKTTKFVKQDLPLVIEQTGGGSDAHAAQTGAGVRVKSVRARVTTPDAELYLGRVHWKRTPTHLEGFELGGKITPTLRGLRIKGFAGVAPQPALTPDKGAALKLWVALPEALGGATSDEPVALTTGGGPGLLLRRAPATVAAAGDLSFTVENAAITPYFTVKKLQVEYTKATDRWFVDGRVVIDAIGGVEAHLTLKIEGKSLKEIFAKLDKLNLCVAQLLCLQRLEMHVNIDAKEFAGKVGLSLLQEVAGYTVASIEGGLTLKFPKGKAYAKVGGDVYLLDALRVAQGYLAVDTGGHVYAEGQAKLFASLVGIGLGVEGKVYVSYDKPHLDVFGKVQACIDVEVVEACAGAEALASTKGLAVCLIIDLVLDDWRPGFAYKWGGGLTIFFAGCDVGPYKATGAALQRGPYQLPPGGATVTLPAGLPGAVVAVQGATAPPKVTLIGPKGEQVSTPTGPGAVRKRPFWLVQVAATKTTYVAIGKPSAGEWKVTQQPGSSPVVSIWQADGIAPPVVEANVSGTGAKRTLSYVFSTRPGQTVTFWERALPGPGVPPAATQVLGRVVSDSRPGRQRGQIGFAPAPGPGGARQIVAQVLQGGVPRRTLVVDTYTAPAPPALGAPPSVSVERSGGRIQIAWEPAPQASDYHVRVDLADGQRRLFHTSSTQRKVRLDGIPPGVGGTVRVTSLRSSTGTLGPARQAAIPG